jgi:hypothetical protein
LKATARQFDARLAALNLGDALRRCFGPLRGFGHCGEAAGDRLLGSFRHLAVALDVVLDERTP